MLRHWNSSMLFCDSLSHSLASFYNCLSSKLVRLYEMCAHKLHLKWNIALEMRISNIYGCMNQSNYEIICDKVDLFNSRDQSECIHFWTLISYFLDLIAFELCLLLYSLSGDNFRKRLNQPGQWILLCGLWIWIT